MKKSILVTFVLNGGACELLPIVKLTEGMRTKDLSKVTFFFLELVKIISPFIIFSPMAKCEGICLLLN